MSALGWNDGNNIHVDYRYGVDPQIVKNNAAELVALAPAVILANAPPSVLAVQQATRTIPVVFAGVTDPVALGLVESLARPGGNITGFSPAELGLSAKWLELLKEIAPALKRVAVFRAASNPGSDPQVAAIEKAARPLGVQIIMIDVSDTAAMERGVAAFAGSPDGGLIAIRTSEDIAARGEIIALAERYRLPAVYPLRFFATGGGLIAYGPDIVEEYREAAGYVDRILNGAKPADLAGAVGKQVRADDQSQNRQAARFDNSADAAGDCRRSDRVSLFIKESTMRRRDVLQALAGAMLAAPGRRRRRYFHQGLPRRHADRRAADPAHCWRRSYADRWAGAARLQARAKPCL